MIGCITLSALYQLAGVGGGRSGALWLPSHHPGGCCTLVVDEEIPPYYVKRFECLEKRYINVTNSFCAQYSHFLYAENMMYYFCHKHTVIAVVSQNAYMEDFNVYFCYS